MPMTPPLSVRMVWKWAEILSSLFLYDDSRTRVELIFPWWVHFHKHISFHSVSVHIIKSINALTFIAVMWDSCWNSRSIIFVIHEEQGIKPNPPVPRYRESSFSIHGPPSSSEWCIHTPQGVVTTMCPVLPPVTAINIFDRQNEETLDSVSN